MNESEPIKTEPIKTAMDAVNTRWNPQSSAEGGSVIDLSDHGRPVWLTWQELDARETEERQAPAPAWRRNKFNEQRLDLGKWTAARKAFFDPIVTSDRVRRLYESLIDPLGRPTR
jgi:hypothetical protein